MARTLVAMLYVSKYGISGPTVNSLVSITTGGLRLPIRIRLSTGKEGLNWPLPSIT